MSNRDELREIVTELRGYLEFYQELGLTHIGGAARPVKEPPAEPAAVSRAEEALPVMPKKEPLQSDLFGESAQAEAADPPAAETLEDIRADIGECTRCRLHEARTRIVFGEGDPNAELVFVGEGPGADEDQQARPFVGRSGQLLTKIIEAMGYRREQVYLANIVKCRPPQNRTPLKDEVGTCEGFLFRQLAVIKPKVIVTLGTPATQTLLRTKDSITGMRGRFFDYRGAKVLPTFHPAYLLRSPEKKREVWEDMKKVRDYLAGRLKPEDE